MQALAITKHDIVAAIKNRYGSVPRFEAEKGLARRSVSDVLRSKPSRKTAEAIAAEVGHSVESLLDVIQSANADDSVPVSVSHCQNADGPGRQNAGGR